MFNFNKNKKFNILVVGANGMLGYDLVNQLKEKQLDKNSKVGVVVALGDDFDMTDINQLNKHFCKTNGITPIKYDFAVNCAALTDTYKIEHDRNYQIKAFDVNVKSVDDLAKLCEHYHTKLIHISTDYVYSQYSADSAIPLANNTVLHAFHKNNATEYPINTYGMQKLIAEDFIKKHMSKKNYAILRTSWLYGNHNHKSFVHKILLNFEKQKQQHPDGKFVFEVTENEYSIPTSTRELVKMIMNVINYNLYGTFAACGHVDDLESVGHYAISRFEFAKAIIEAFYVDAIRCPDSVVFDQLNRIVRTDILNPTYSRMYNDDIDETTLKFLDGVSNEDTDWKKELLDFMHMYRIDIGSWINEKLKEN